MNLKLYDEYGSYNKNGYWINNHEKWDYYAKRPKLYQKNKILAWCFLLIPIYGIVVSNSIFNTMGLDII